MTLTFDFGSYSTELRHAKKAAYIITKKSIAGRSAKLASPRTPRNGNTGVLVRLKRRYALCLWEENLTVEQRALVLKIFETLRFGEPVPPSMLPPPPRPPAKDVD